MGENARSQTLGAIGNNVVKRACDKRGRPIGARMTKGKRNSHDGEREPVKFAKWNSLEMFVDNKAKQETAPENFFHQRNDDNKTKETKKNRRPISSRVVLKQCRVEANGTRREVKEILRPDPDAKNGHRDEQAKDDIFQSMKLVAATALATRPRKISNATRSKFRFPVHHYSCGANCILLVLLTHERNARTTSSTFAGDRRIPTLRSARDQGKDSIGHVVDTAPRRFAELTPRKAHPDRNIDFQVCAPSGVLLR